MNARRSLPSTAVLLVSALFLVSQANAINYEGEIKKCSSLSVPEERLKCYDSITGTSSHTAKSEKHKESSPQAAGRASDDVRQLEEVFCGSNMATLRTDPFGKNEEKELIDCLPAMKFFLTKWSGNPGYVWGNVRIYKNGKLYRSGWIENTELLTAEEWAQRRAESEQLQREHQEKIAERERGIAKQPPAIQELIRKKRIRIGMNKDAVRLSWGEPDEVNRTVFSGGVHEQWVYGNGTFLYIEDDVLTAFQD